THRQGAINLRPRSHDQRRNLASVTQLTGARGGAATAPAPAPENPPAGRSLPTLRLPSVGGGTAGALHAEPPGRCAAPPLPPDGISGRRRPGGRGPKTAPESGSAVPSR